MWSFAGKQERIEHCQLEASTHTRASLSTTEAHAAHSHQYNTDLGLAPLAVSLGAVTHVTAERGLLKCGYPGRAQVATQSLH